MALEPTNPNHHQQASGAGKRRQGVKVMGYY